MILFSVLSSLVLACTLICLHPACFMVVTFSHLKYTLNLCNFLFSSIIISSDSWAGRHHMLPWSAPFNLIQTWLVFFSTLEFSVFWISFPIWNYMLFAGNSWWGGGCIQANAFWHFNPNLRCSPRPCRTRFQISFVAFMSLFESIFRS